MPVSDSSYGDAPASSLFGLSFHSFECDSLIARLRVVGALKDSRFDQSPIDG
jgi:hypothetical protein